MISTQRTFPSSYRHSGQMKHTNFCSTLYNDAYEKALTLKKTQKQQEVHEKITVDYNRSTRIKTNKDKII